MRIDVELLLNGKIEENYNDKIFWYATKVKIKNNRVDIFIENNNLITFDNVDLDIKKISDFININQQDRENLNNVLVSSGSFLFSNNKLLVTQRELTTKYDPGFWTTPAGRCDRTIFDTGIKETIEEIKIEKDKKILYPKIAKKFVNSNENIEYYETFFESKNFNLKIYEVNLYLENKLIETCNSWMYYSESVNTLEFRIPIFSTLDENNLTFSNPEFKTPTALKSVEELKKLQCVPALKKLLEEINNEQQ